MNEELRSILNADGSCEEEFKVLIPDDDLLAILQTIVLNRVMDRRLMRLQRQGRLGFYLTSTGEEVVTVGAAYAMRENDPIFLTYRELGALLWRDVPLDAIMNQLIGNAQDITKGRQMPVHYCYREYHIPSVSSPVGTPIASRMWIRLRSENAQDRSGGAGFLGRGHRVAGGFPYGLEFQRGT